MPYKDLKDLKDLQDGNGLIVELFVSGRRSRNVFPKYEPRTIICSCFYPMHNNISFDLLPKDLQTYMNNEYVIGAESMHIRKHGMLEVPFQLFDVAKKRTDI